MNKTVLFLTGFLFVCLSVSLDAQKYGHVNSGNLLEQLPEVKTADAEMKKLQEQLMKERESKMAAFQTKYEKAMAAFQSGELSPKQQQEKEQQLRSEQEALQKFEQNMQAQIAQKREQLLQPILTRVDEAIEAVAKEGGYAMIFDTSTGRMLYAKDSEDLMAKVKAKLGI